VRSRTSVIWKNLSDEELLESMGGNEKGRPALIQELRKVAGNVKSVTPAMALMIQGSAEQIERFKRGIGTIPAATMIAEIIDTRRFVCEGALPLTAGWG